MLKASQCDICKSMVNVLWSYRSVTEGLKTTFAQAAKGKRPMHAKRLRELLSALNVAAGPQDLGRPGWRLHPLTGAWLVTGR